MNMLTKLIPVFTQNILISTYNTYQYKIRHGGKYRFYREYYRKFSTASIFEIQAEQERRLEKILKISVSKSKWYKYFIGFDSLNDFPILSKEDLINNLEKITTISEKNAVVSLTGGTTGASMKVLYTKQDTQERHALLDHFRAEYGYVLGKKCAWFTGKNIATKKDILKGNCYRDDYINKIRFFSTFHITDSNFDTYWKAFCKFAPEYIVGFPSSVYELCSMAVARDLKLNDTVKVFFPTAETLLPHHREVIGTVLGCKIANQYASSEGAPFILECKEGGLHIHPLSGVFEVVDEYMNPAQEGEILVTSFTTEGTPLIRYRIGDCIKLAPQNKQCSCGSNFQLVESIQGRSNDYILSPNNGKVNLGNISNATKNVAGIICFQLIQHTIELINVNIVVNEKYNKNEEKKFISALRERVGESIDLDIRYLDSIPKERSGKFRVVKNMIGK